MTVMNVNSEMKIIVWIISVLLLSVVCVHEAFATPALKVGDEWTFDYTYESYIRIPGEPEVSGSAKYSAYVKIEEIRTVDGTENVTYYMLSMNMKRTSSVILENSHVSLSCYASDWEGNDYFDSLYVSISAEPFVDPIWAAHASDWNSSIDDAEEEGVTVVEESASNGKFHVKLQAAYESDYNDDGIEEKGTRTIQLDTEYDSDGVLVSSTQVDLTEYADGTRVQTITKMVRAGGINLLLLTAIGGIAIVLVTAIILKRRKPPKKKRRLRTRR